MATRSIRHLSVTSIILITALTFFVLGSFVGYQAKTALAAEEPDEFGIFWETWDLVLASV